MLLATPSASNDRPTKGIACGRVLDDELAAARRVSFGQREAEVQFFGGSVLPSGRDSENADSRPHWIPERHGAGGRSTGNGLPERCRTVLRHGCEFVLAAVRLLALISYLSLLVGGERGE